MTRKDSPPSPKEIAQPVDPKTEPPLPEHPQETDPAPAPTPPEVVEPSDAPEDPFDEGNFPV